MDEPKYPDVVVKLINEDGNAFFIIGRVVAALREAGIQREELDQFRQEAMSGNYDNVLLTCMKWVTIK